LAPNRKRGETVTVRIPLVMWERIGKLTDRLGADILDQGIDPPSRASVLRRALDLGIHSLGRTISKRERERSSSRG
jgi:hypothetical protein